MTNRIEQLINSRTALNLGISLARAVPPWLGYSIVSLVTRWISLQRYSSLVRAVRTNQWVATGQSSSREALDKAVREVFYQSGRSIYELYHYLQNPEAAGRLYIFEPAVLELLKRPEFDQRGLVVGGLHMGNYDLAVQWATMNSIRPLILTVPDPEGGRRLEFDIRKKTGMDLVPTSINGLRRAIRHLNKGGAVMTAIDFPMKNCQPGPRFFKRPVCLPNHYVYLALNTDTPVIVMMNRLEEDGKYHVFTSSPIEMDHYANRTDALICNTEKVLSTAEEFIRQAPQQWTISHPVWPDLIVQTSL